MTLVLLAWVVVANQQTISGLSESVEGYQQRINELETAVIEERAKIAVLHRFVADNSQRLKSYERKKVLTVTAYSPRAQECDADPHITATNRRVRPGIIAVSRDLFDKGWVFGRKVYIKGMGVYTIDDLMHQRKTNQIDVFMPETGKAVRFGVQTMEVFLLDT
jgi:3D (Asp-Asp-Asp) domain-containing protein